MLISDLKGDSRNILLWLNSTICFPFYSSAKLTVSMFYINTLMASIYFICKSEQEDAFDLDRATGTLVYQLSLSIWQDIRNFHYTATTSTWFKANISISWLPTCCLFQSITWCNSVVYCPKVLFNPFSAVCLLTVGEGARRLLQNIQLCPPKDRNIRRKENYSQLESLKTQQESSPMKRN